ncbi:MAG: hypothetical protein ACRD0G_00965 [Acidimicrobiales bacterium]
MKPADIGSVHHIDDVRLSPDGQLVAFTVTTVDLDANDYRSCVWVGPTDGSAPPAPFTAGDKRDGAARWSPDGARLAFVSHRQEGTGVTIHVAPVVGGGEVRQVAEWTDAVDALEWSPDGARSRSAPARRTPTATTSSPRTSHPAA